jgi:hypothetical protein
MENNNTIPAGLWTVRELGDANCYCIDSDGKWLLSFRHNGEALLPKQREAIAEIVSNHNAMPVIVANLRATIASMEWAASAIRDIPPGSNFAQTLNEAKALLASLTA